MSKFCMNCGSKGNLRITVGADKRGSLIERDVKVILEGGERKVDVLICNDCNHEQISLEDES